MWLSFLPRIKGACHSRASCWMSMAYMKGSHVVKEVEQ